MPSLTWNREKWDGAYDWSEGGDEWSASWGGPERHWKFCILPRIRSFLPAKNVLEIAPGFGRFTAFLKDQSEQLTVVDASERCIAHCRERFADSHHLKYFGNDGRSLSMVDDASMDFVFSYDSLVHADSVVLEAYLSQLAVKLARDGVGFIHHSNARAHSRYFLLRRVRPVRRLLRLPSHHSRDFSVDAALVEGLADRAGLQCLSQETVNWGQSRTIDCFTVFARKGSEWGTANSVLDNPRFMEEAEEIRRAGSDGASSNAGKFRYPGA